ncbi:DEAD/DEAH box helicase [Myxococcota bacterium]|nr:DEAD/DEAH box helicase [Myxococcota bacterium]MBU1382813.1 DEAD/DEAH box helicase [Myxococcota bacterium]MBU1497364.1 DEAD/DEAH box helicase [Myxococcota bacterium]
MSSLETLDYILKGNAPHPFQKEIINKFQYSRKHIFIDAPCGSGKTAPLFAICSEPQIKVSILLFPLRTLAKSKYHEFRKLFPEDRTLFITGLNHEGDAFIFDGNKITIFTTWEYYAFNFMAFEPDLIIIDEAQNILTTTRRTSILDICLFNENRSSRIILAGFNYVKHIRDLISPADYVVKDNIFRCDIINIGKKIDDIVNFIQEYPDGIFLIFAATRRRAESLSRSLGTLTGIEVNYYHSGLPVDTKDIILNSVTSGNTRVLVSTTALAQGIDLPFSHVIFTDTSIPSAHSLSENDIIQISGRAGRRGKPAILASTKSISHVSLKIDTDELALRCLAFSNENWFKTSEKLEMVPVFRKVRWGKLLNDLRIGEVDSVFFDYLIGKNIPLESWCKFLKIVKELTEMVEIYPFDLMIILNIAFLIESGSLNYNNIDNTSIILKKFNDYPVETAVFFGISIKALERSIQKSAKTIQKPSKNFQLFLSHLKNAFLKTSVNAHTKEMFMELFDSVALLAN